MKSTNYLTNLANKSPKLLFLLLVLFGISLHQDTLFGVSLDSPSADASLGRVDIPRSVLNDHYHADVVLSTQDSVYYDVLERGSGQRLGGVISSVKRSDISHGYAGATPVIILLDPNDVIQGVVPLANHETPRFIARLETAGFFDQWNGLHIFDDMPEVQAVSGATRSSVSLICNVDAALETIVVSHRSTPSDITGYVGSLAVLIVVLGSLACFLFPAQTKRYRLLLLAASVGVLGIWQGAFVSIDLLVNWFVHGTTFWDRFALVAIVALAIALPLLTGKAFYCQYVCPFGAAQELVGRCTPTKKNMPPFAVRAFHWVRRLFLVAIVVLILCNPNFEPASVEPFTVFLIQSAGISALMIAGVSLVGSLFVFKPWCRLLCPTGEVLSMLSKKINYARHARSSRSSGSLGSSGRGKS